MTDSTTITDLTTEQQLLLMGCFVTTTRYGGKYEGTRWTAFTRDTAAQYVFNLTPTMVKLGGDAFGDDEACRWWWENHSHLVGLGDTPDAAVLDLVEKLGVENCDHFWLDVKNEAIAGGLSVCNTCGKLGDYGLGAPNADSGVKLGEHWL